MKGKCKGEFLASRRRHQARQKLYDALTRLRVGASTVEYVTLDGKRLKCMPATVDVLGWGSPLAIVSSRRGPVLAEMVYKDGIHALTKDSSFQPKTVYCNVVELHERH